MSTQDKIMSLIADATKVEVTTLTEETKFIDDLNLDSLDMVELMMKMEDEFEIEIPEGDADKLSSVGDVMNYLKDKNIK